MALVLIDREQKKVYIFSMFAALFRIVFIAFVLYIAYLFYRVFIIASRRRRSNQAPRKIQGVMVKDKICNTYIPKDEALRERHGGQEHFFCSVECRRKFLEQKEAARPPS